MRKILIGALLALVASSSLAQGGSQLLEKFNRALYSAKTLNVSFTVQIIGGNPSNYKLELAKPNMVKVDTSVETITADGTSITTYNKKEKTYFKIKQTDAEVMKLMMKGDLYVWAPFFNDQITKNYVGVKSLGTKSRKGVSYQALEFMMPGGRTTKVTYYLDGQDFIARQADFVTKSLNVQETAVLNTTSLVAGTAAPDQKLFAFNPPAGSRELTPEEVNAGKWYTDLDTAVEVAKKTNKLVLAFFSADW